MQYFSFPFHSKDDTYIKLIIFSEGLVIAKYDCFPCYSYPSVDGKAIKVKANLQEKLKLSTKRKKITPFSMSSSLLHSTTQGALGSHLEYPSVDFRLYLS